MQNYLYSFVRYSVILFVALYSAESAAVNNILDRIEVQDSRDQSVIKITFTERLIYRSHAPQNTGDLIHIDLNLQVSTADVVLEPEFLIWKANSTVPLFEASLEPKSPVQADLVLRFNQEVKYDVQGSSDSYSIIITIYHPQQEQPITLPDITVTDIIPLVPEFQKNAANEVLAKLMEEARQSMAKEDYPTAIKLYTKVLGNDQSVFSKQALEYLGVAREKQKQLAHAKSIYDQYLKRYPKGEDAARVRQRLLAMLSISDVPKEKLRDIAKIEKELAPEWELFGGFSQLYNRNVSLVETAGREVTQDELRSDLDFTTRLRADNYDLEARFSGGHTANFLPDVPKSEDRVSSFYFDAKDKVRGASLRFGRQSRTTGGVLGRFDGIFGDYQYKEKVKLNFVVGYPVDSSRDVRIETERYFYGISADIGTVNKLWDFNVFAINQENDGLTDRRAIGGEVRYFDRKKSLFTLIDYDIFYDELNLFIFNTRLSLSDKTTFNMNYDYRTTPILTTRNALTGQTVTHLQDLLNIFPKGTVFDLAEDRTASSHMLFTGLTHQLNKQFQLNGDIRLSKLTDTKSSGGVIASEGTDIEKDYSLQLTGTSLIKEGDLAILTTTYSDLTTSDITTVTLNTRYPITQKLRINPRFRIRYRDNHSDNSTQKTYSPSIQLTYRMRRNFQLEAEVSGDWEYTKPDIGETEKTRNFFFLAGYRYDF
ncbi:MAG: hypothetical protein ACKE9I_01400 [Methylophagaceae bacterium]